MKHLFSFSQKFKHLSVLLPLILAHAMPAQVPATYYNTAIGLTGSSLKQELHDITTAGHSPLSYAQLWTAFGVTDRDLYYENDNMILDMYSENPSGADPYEFTYSTEQCGTFSVEGDCYNREHSFPKSWWGGAESGDKYTDLNHLVPTDGYVNGRRDNNPFGEVGTASWTSLNGSKLGTSNYPGISGTVFEPIDEFKGDFARVLFYMATRYKDEMPTWYATGTEIQTVFQSSGEFQTAYLNMIYAWHLADPPSQKEIDRNDDVYDQQGNANPYIDHPEWVCEVWFSGTCSATPTLAVTPSTVSGLTYVFGNGPSASQSFSLSGTGLTGYPSNIIVTAPSNFEVSLSSGSGYAASVNVPYTSAVLSATTIYVRLKSGLAVNTYSGSITLAGGGDTDGASVSVSGSVTAAVPTLTVTPTSLTGFTYVFGAGPSTQQSYSISGAYLTGFPGNITVTAPTNYEVSLTSGSGFAASVSVPYASATLSAVTVYVRLKSGLSVGTYGPVNVSNAGGGATTVNVAVTGSVTSASGDCPNDLFFSEYIEGSSNNKLIEIFNGTGTSISLSGYSVKIYANGSASATTTIALTTTSSIANNDVWVLVNSSANATFLALADQTNAGLSFNGDDAVALFNGTTMIDLFGNIGCDPGTAWTSTSNTTVDKTLVRKSSVQTGILVDDPISSPCGFSTLESEWTQYNTDVITYVGSHTMDACGGIPTITLTPATLSGFTYQVGSGPSAEQSFSISGNGLTGAISIVPPTDYEISTGTGVAFTATNPVTLTQSGGSVSNTIIYVRLKAGLAIGTYNTETVTASSSGATDQTVTCNGTVTGVPLINVSPTSLSGFTYEEGSGPSSEQSFTISGSYLTSAVSIVPPADYQISTGTGGAFVATNPITLNPTGGTLANTTIYVRLKAGLITGTYNSETITASSVGASNKTVTCNGTVTARPTITVTSSTLSGFTYVLGFGPSPEQSYSISGVDLTADISLVPPADYEISTGTGGLFVATNPITLSQSGGSVSNTIIYVRLKAGLAIGSYNTEAVTASTSGALNKTVTCNGTVTVAPSAGCATELIISEYGEGSSSNKYIELYNGTGSSVTLTGFYRIGMISNGGSWTESNIALTGTIADGDVFVIANSLAGSTVIAAADQTSGSLTFNGDDAVALQKYNGSIWENIDMIGTDGTDPGTGWTVAGVTNATAMHTLVRKAFITGPETNWTISAGTDASSSEWVVYPADTWTYLGSHTMTCTCEEPSVHASNLNFSSITTTSMTVNWTLGDGVSRIVVAREGLPVNWTPTDLNTYNGNASFGSGTQLGTGNYVVYNGSASGFTLSNLTAGTTYYFKIFEYGCAPGSEDYLTSGTAEEGHATTIPNNITNLAIDCSTAGTMEISWNLPTGNYDGILITVLQGGTPPAPDCEGIGLNNPLTDYTLASVYCANASGAKYMYNGIGTNVSISGLTSGASYTVKAFVYKNSAWSSGIDVTDVAELSDVNFLNAACGNTSSLVGWSNPNTACYDEVIIVARTASISGTPSGTYTANSSSYTDPLNPTFPGGGVVVYTGPGEFVDVTSLSNNTTYYFKAFVRNGTDWSNGVQDNCMPTTASILDYGDLAIVGINTDTDDPDSGNDPDEIQFVCFKPITTLTSIDMTDNGYERLYADLWADSEGFLRFTRTGDDLPSGTIVTVRGRNAAGNWHVFIGDGTDTHTLVNDDANWTVTDGGVGNQLFDLNENDQIWIMQGGEWLNPGGVHNSTYTGKILYGWTAIGWEPAPGYDDTKGSTIFPSSGCSVTNLVGVANEDKVRYNGVVTAATQRVWISRFNDEVLWIGSGTTAEYDASGTLPDEIVILTGGFSTTAQWTGETSTNWDDCTNWLNLKVPDAGTNVLFVTDNCSNDIVLLPGQLVYCNDLTITGLLATHNIKIKGDATKIIEIRGDLTIGGPNALDLDDANSATPDGKISIYGDWNNTIGTGAFMEGNSTVEFVGTDVQYINTSDVSEDFSSLSVNNYSSEGLVLNDHIQTGGTLSLIGGLLNLKGFDLTINGAYTRNSGFFAGDAASDILVQGTGTLAPFYFSDPQVLNSFSMNRTSGISALATNLTTNNLTITAGTVQLNAGKYFTVNNTITNALASGLWLKSDATGTASLIHHNEGIPAISERYIEGGAWAYVFPPLSSVSEGIMGGANPNFYWYNEIPVDYWNTTTIYGTTGWTDVPGGALSTARGYIVYHPSTQVYNLTGGSLNYNIATGNTVFTASYTDSGLGPVNLNGVTADWNNFEGWNLFGNPFTSAIDWDQTLKTDVENMVYYYDGAAQNYRYYGSGTVYDIGITLNGGSRYVPANQAFMVKATVNGGTLTIPNSARVHDAVAFWKNGKTIPTNLIRMEVEKDGFTDETVIRSIPEATYMHDALFDAYKMFSYDKSKPMLYSRTLDNSFMYALNTLPLPKEHEIVPLGLYVGQSGDYTIRITQNSYEGMHVWLEDALTKTEINLREQADYTFSQSLMEQTERFYLHLGLNRPPKLMLQVPDQQTKSGEPYRYELPKGLFSDEDFGDKLILKADLTSGKALPEWLHFDVANAVLEGTPYENQRLEIRLTATDIFGAQALETFVLDVKSVLGVTDALHMVSIYPNPASDVIAIHMKGIQKAECTITDLSGKEMMKTVLLGEKTMLNVSGFAKGIYFIVISSEEGGFRQKLIIK